MKFSKEFCDIISAVKSTLSFLDKREKGTLILATCIMLIAGILTNLPAVILGGFVDKLISLENPNFTLAIPFIGGIILIVVFKEILTVIRKYLIENIATQTEKQVTVGTINHLLKTDISGYFSQYQLGSLHGRVFRSIAGLIQMIKILFLEFFPTFFTAIAAVAIAFIQKPFLASIMILVVPTGLYIVFLQLSSQKGIRILLLRGKEKIDGKLVEMMGGLETIRVAGTTQKEVQKIEDVVENLRKTEIKHHIHMSLYDAAKYLNEAFFYILVISLSIYFATKGIISKGDILTYSILFMSIITPLRVIHRILDEAHESSIKISDLEEIFSQRIDIAFMENKKGSKIDCECILEIKKLSFSYKNTQILKNISLGIMAGEKIGIAGASGCGKSTLIKILLRLYHGYNGKIHFLGSDLQNLSRDAISRRVAYISQKSYIFAGTIKENVTYGIKNNYSNNDIVTALKQASIHNEVMNSLGGLNGILTENGNNLSGGQKQRLALARVILQKPQFLILDEATSALDNKNESIVQKSIEKIFKDATIITIAHRLTTLKNSDRIYVLDAGRIVQQGDYGGLAEEKGLFKEFLKQKNT